MSLKKTAPKILAAAALFTVSAAGTAYWSLHQQQSPAEHNELAASFCPAMANPQAYKDKRVQTYATLIPGRDGWIFRTKNDFRTDWKIKDSTLAQMAALQKAMRTHNAELVIVMPPVRGMVHTDHLFTADRKKYNMQNPQMAWDAYENFISETRNAGVDIVGLNRSEINATFFYKRNHHWSADGARATAQKLAGVIKTLPAYTQIPKTSYASKPQKSADYKSSYDGAFVKICGTHVPPEEAHIYETAPSDTATNAQALFESSEPQVVLLGTSNSVNESSEANFDGFLKEYLSADVLNLAVAGAGIDTSIISYLNSAHYKDNKPKIVIWEIPGYYNLDVMSDTVFRQAIPAAYGTCGEDAVASGNYTGLIDDSPIYASQDSNTPGTFAAGQDPRQANLDTNNDLYLRLAFAQPVKKEFSVKFHYKVGDQGTTKLIKFKRSNRYPADGEFYTVFPQMEKGAELNKIRLTLPTGAKMADVAMQVCALPNDEPTPRDESM